MTFAKDLIMLRVFLRRTDMCGRLTTAEYILVYRAELHGLAGGTVSQGIHGADADVHNDPVPLGSMTSSEHQWTDRTGEWPNWRAFSSMRRRRQTAPASTAK